MTPEDLANLEAAAKEQMAVGDFAPALEVPSATVLALIDELRRLRSKAEASRIDVDGLQIVEACTRAGVHIVRFHDEEWEQVGKWYRRGNEEADLAAALRNADVD
jgi:hypothetical protein